MFILVFLARPKPDVGIEYQQARIVEDGFRGVVVR
jgi:hypothetical protein